MAVKPRQKPEEPEKPRKKRGLTKDEFRAQNDYSTKVRLAIRKVLRTLGPDEILKDGEFRAEAGVAGNHGWREIAAEPEFLPYQFVLGDVRNGLFWALPRTTSWACSNVAKARRLE